MESPVVETSGQSYTSSSYTAPTPAVNALPNYDLQPLESDVILTFSQTIQDLEAQGGRDLSRYPAMNELYDTVNGLRPKLAFSLDDKDKKESGYLTSISFLCFPKYFARSSARDA